MYINDGTVYVNFTVYGKPQWHTSWWKLKGLIETCKVASSILGDCYPSKYLPVQN